MTARKVFHVVPTSRPGGWAVKEPLAAAPLSSYARKTDAIAEAKRLCRAAGRARMVIHGIKGQILADIIIGGDPCSPAG